MKNKETELNLNEEIELLISNLDKVKCDYVRILDKYSKKFSDADKKQQDILHYIEFKNMSSVAGFRLIKELKEVRKERRDAEDIVDLLNKLRQGFHLSAEIKGTAKMILDNKISNMKTRKYKERIYTENDLDNIANLPEYIEN